MDSSCWSHSARRCLASYLDVAFAVDVSHFLDVDAHRSLVPDAFAADGLHDFAAVYPVTPSLVYALPRDACS